MPVPSRAVATVPEARLLAFKAVSAVPTPVNEAPVTAPVTPSVVAMVADVVTAKVPVLVEPVVTRLPPVIAPDAVTVAAETLEVVVRLPTVAMPVTPSVPPIVVLFVTASEKAVTRPPTPNAPVIVVAPVTANVPPKEPLPEDTTEVGVMSPSAIVIAGVVPCVAIVPETPLAVVTVTAVTVPVGVVFQLLSPARYVVADAVPVAPSRATGTVPLARLVAFRAVMPDPGPTKPTEAVIVVPPMVVPDKAPVDATDVGVMAPNVNVMAGVPVPATVPETPLAVITETAVTAVMYVEAPVRNVVAEAVPEPSTAGATVPEVRLLALSAVIAEPAPASVAPETAPVAATDVGVIAPKTKVIAGVVEAVATVPVMPLALTTDTVVTLPKGVVFQV